MVSRLLFVFSILSMVVNAGLFDFVKYTNFEESYKSKEYNKSAKILKTLKVDSAAFRYDMGNSYYKLGRYKEAIKYYKRAFGEDVDELSRIYNIANCYYNLQEYEKAILAYKTALKIRDDKDVRANLALAIKKLNEPKKEKKESKKKKKKKEKNGKSKKKNNKKLSKEQLKKLKELAKKRELQKELKNMLNSSLKERKVEVLMYRVKEGDTKNSNLNPW